MHPHFILLAAVNLVPLQVILVGFGYSGLEVLNVNLKKQQTLVGGE